MRKSSEKTLVNVDLYNYGDSINAIPARHSKSLDHLQMCSRARLHYSLGNIYGQNDFYTKDHYGKTNFYKNESKLKNVSSEHNMRNQKVYSNYEDPWKKRCDYDICNCSFYDSKKIKKKDIDINQIDLDILDKKYKQFNIKKLGSIRSKDKNQKIVKSLSHTSTDSTQNMFRSNSMQTFSPKKNSETKFNSLVTTRRSSGKIHSNGFSQSILESTKNNNHKSSKLFEVTSTSSSTDSLFSKKSGFNIEGIRKVKSTSCLGETGSSQVLSGTESLPNLTPKMERVEFPQTKYYSSSSSSSSSTSEQSGWITSRSSSIASSTDVTNPLSTTTLLTSIDSIQKKILSIAQNDRKSGSRRTRKKTVGKRKFEITINGHHSKKNGKSSHHDLSLSNKGKKKKF